jgi:hypothetical protein
MTTLWCDRVSFLKTDMRAPVAALDELGLCDHRSRSAPPSQPLDLLLD